jgi:hypothetical protein
MFARGGGSIRRIIAETYQGRRCYEVIYMIISYVVLICLSLCFVTLTVVRLGNRFRDTRNRSQTGAGKWHIKLDPQESLRRMVEDRYGSSWRVVAAEKGELH